MRFIPLAHIYVWKGFSEENIKKVIVKKVIKTVAPIVAKKVMSKVMNRDKKK